MKPISPVPAALAALLLALPIPAEAFNARRNMHVNPVDAAVFEVIAPSAAPADDYWCGAADYAQRALGMPWIARIYIARGRGPSVTTQRRTAVQFTVQPEVAGVQPLDPVFMLNMMKPGDNMTVAHALSFCNQPPVQE
ncbi:hypothetical protein [Antarcticimicrobium sediminis]|uniref:Uncharacterized protein n=1 Tax=Antarcticimicrobium sediminis TaxID=2546227 RepID=A0A4V2Z8M7_9RHOB|nr:hypothetical protein [Antarcticimicrobium sediminis]TDE40966.1 hypothetical protein E1B25_01770 [Antarcticimicrobium sediminis]